MWHTAMGNYATYCWGKYTSLNAYIKKNRKAYLKKLKKGNQMKLQVNRIKKVINTRIQINVNRSCFLEDQ